MLGGLACQQSMQTHKRENEYSHVDYLWRECVSFSKGGI